MDFHLERKLRLHTDPKHKNLYKWAINEIDPEGKEAGRDQIPWEWTLWFSATSCKLSNGVEINAPFKFKFTVTTEDGQATEQESGGRGDRIDHRQSIHIELRPGRTLDDENQPVFSMLGTKRLIKSFQLNIVQLTDPAENEQCNAWGCASYTSEGADFRDETTDDCLVFYFAVKSETFTNYLSKISQGQLNEIVFRVGKVGGFYSEWSPSITTDRVKVLTADKEHKITLPPDCQIEPPRLGKVGDVALYMNRRLEFVRQAKPTPDDPEADAPKHKFTAYDTDRAGRKTQEDPQMKILRSLRRAAWFGVGILALIFVVIFLRR